MRANAVKDYIQFQRNNIFNDFVALIFHAANAVGFTLIHTTAKGNLVVHKEVSDLVAAIFKAQNAVRFTFHLEEGVLVQLQARRPSASSLIVEHLNKLCNFVWAFFFVLENAVRSTLW